MIYQNNHSNSSSLMNKLKVSTNYQQQAPPTYKPYLNQRFCVFDAFYFFFFYVWYKSPHFFFF